MLELASWIYIVYVCEKDGISKVEKLLWFVKHFESILHTYVDV